MSIVAFLLLLVGCVRPPSVATFPPPATTIELAGDQASAANPIAASSQSRSGGASGKEIDAVPAMAIDPTVSDAEVSSVLHETEEIALVASSAGHARELANPPVSPAKAFTEQVFLPEDLVSLTVVHPHEISKTPFGKLLPLLAEAFDVAGGEFDKLVEQIGVRPEDLDRVVVFTTADRPDSREKPESEAVEATKEEAEQQVDDAPEHLGLREIYRGLQDYVAAYSRLPRADGDSQGKNVGLSWRVHLLPFLDQDELYGQFHLDEPWDSTHNKALISRMPEIFRTRDVEDEGKTAIHVLTGEGTFFPGGRLGFEFTELNDEAKTTILFVLSRPDCADVWTKPGGLVADFRQPKKIFAQDDGEPILVMLADGDVTNLHDQMPDQQIAQLMRLDKSDDVEELLPLPREVNQPRGDVWQSMHQLAAAFGQYHEAYFLFPRANGDGPGFHTGLSWRVHLLPFLDQRELYAQFHLDEPWDSDHNKPLINRMPDVFLSPNVLEEGKTSFHVFIGEKTLFHGRWGVKREQIADPLNRTIVAVAAGSNTADYWTKPGGLAVDLKSPQQILGNVDPQRLCVVFANGGVEHLVLDDDFDLASYIQPNVGGTSPAEVPEEIQAFGGQPLPGLIVTFNKDVDQIKLAKHLLHDLSDDEPASEEEFIAERFHHDDDSAIWFPDDRTLVTGPIETVKRIVINHRAGKVLESTLISKINFSAHLSIVADIDAVAPQFQLGGTADPGLAFFQTLSSIALHVRFSPTAGDPFIVVDCETKQPPVEEQLQAAFWVGWTILGGNPDFALGVPGKPDTLVMDVLQKMKATSSVELSKERVQIHVPVVEGFDQFPAALERADMLSHPDMKEAEHSLALHHLATALFHYHEAVGSFPGAGRRTAQSSVGLSWRVYLLPLLGEPELFHQFRLNEPWDSDHNKTLIEKMPRIFATEDAKAAGQSAIHLLVGPGTAFADDRAPTLEDFAGDPSFKILAVVAGADRAEIWTKPGGLDVDPEHPLNCLGRLPGDFFRAVMASGDVGRIKKAIDPKILRWMIEFRDEAAVEIPEEQMDMIQREASDLMLNGALDGIIF